MLVSTEGLPGPVMMNRLGKPTTCRPRYDFGPSAQASLSRTLPRPRISMRVRAPVMASKPVAKIRSSNSYDASAVRRPVGVTAWIGAALTSTRVTLSRL